jgi:hypothetical protein
MTKRTSKKRTSRNLKKSATLAMLAKARKHGGMVSRPEFILDMPATNSSRRASFDYWTKTEAMQAAKAAGTSDLPAVLWKRTPRGLYRPYAVVVEGRVLR